MSRTSSLTLWQTLLLMKSVNHLNHHRSTTTSSSSSTPLSSFHSELLLIFPCLENFLRFSWSSHSFTHSFHTDCLLNQQTLSCLWENPIPLLTKQLSNFHPDIISPPDYCTWLLILTRHRDWYADTNWEILLLFSFSGDVGLQAHLNYVTERRKWLRNWTDLGNRDSGCRC